MRFILDTLICFGAGSKAVQEVLEIIRVILILNMRNINHVLFMSSESLVLLEIIVIGLW